MTKAPTTCEDVKCRDCYSENVRYHRIRNDIIQYRCRDCEKCFTPEPDKSGYRLNKGYCDKLLQYIIDTVPERHTKITLYKKGEVSKRTVDRYWKRSMLTLLYTLANGLHNRYPGIFKKKAKNDTIYFTSLSTRVQKRIQFAFQIAMSEITEYEVKLIIKNLKHDPRRYWARSENIKFIDTEQSVHIYYKKHEVKLYKYLSPIDTILKGQDDLY